MNTLELLNSLKGEQESNGLKYIKHQDDSSDTLSSDEKVSDSNSAKQEVSSDKSSHPENEVLGGVRVSNFDIQMEDQERTGECDSPEKETPKRKRKRNTTRDAAVNVYAKGFSKKINSYADLDDKYSFLEEDNENSFTRSSKKAKLTSEESHSQVPLQPVTHSESSFIKPSLQGSQSNYVNPNCIIISRELFALLVSMSDKSIISQYPNDYQFIYSPDFYSRFNESTPPPRIVQSFPQQQQFPVKQMKQIVVPFEQKRFPCAAVSHLNMKRCVVQTKYGYAFLSSIIPRNGLMFRLARTIPIVTQRCVPFVTIRAFAHRKRNVLNHEVWEEVKRYPVAESYKKKEQEKRRVLIQEGESDDTEVIFWDEHIRPEDVMEGEELQAYYRSERNLYANDTSSTDEEQHKKMLDLAKIMQVNPEDLTGYKTIFQGNQRIEDGIPIAVEKSFNYFEQLMKNHPELQPDFDLWYKKLDSLANMNVKKMSNREYQSIAQCPQSILNVVDSAHIQLFKVNKKDFEGDDFEETAPNKVETNHLTVEETKKTTNRKVQKGQLQTKVEYTINLMFDSIWKQNPPIAIEYISNSSKLQDIYIYIKMKSSSEYDEETVLSILNKNKSCFDDMMKLLVTKTITPNVEFRFVK